jgi:soluble lytic murein transglycosylase
LVCAGVWSPPALALNDRDQKLYREAFQAIDQSKWSRAQELARQAQDGSLRKVIQWLELRRPASGASFDQIVAFDRANPHWPQRNRLTLRAEDALPQALPDPQVAAWFRQNPPRTPTGWVRYIQALANQGDTRTLQEQVRNAWAQPTLTSPWDQQLLQAYGHHLRPDDHVRRMDALVWDGSPELVRPFAHLLPDAWRAVYEARAALRAGKRDGAALAERVPAAFNRDPGLVYDHARWLRQQNRDEPARRLLENGPLVTSNHDTWWREREIQARRTLRDGNVTQAYRIAANHGLGDAPDAGSAEFLAGFIALRFLNEPESALAHFRRVHDGSSSPYYLSRGAYWAGEASAALRRADAARDWHMKSARWTTTFYGQLSAARLRQLGGTLPEEPRASGAEQAHLAGNELARIVRALKTIGREDQATPFLFALNDSARTPGERHLAGQLASESGKPNIAVMIARRALRDGVVLSRSGFPTMSVGTDGPEPALVHALIRQESNFDPKAVSRAKAKGLMQLMPATASETARKLQVAYSETKLTADPGFNVKLGRAYLQKLLQDFDGSYPLALAGYNAGPGRPRAWVREFGDPRRAEIDVVDWIELIPFNETRTYVQRVLEAVHVYRARLNQLPANGRNRFAGADWCLVNCTTAAPALLEARAPLPVPRAAEAADPSNDPASEEPLVSRSSQAGRGTNAPRPGREEMAP